MLNAKRLVAILVCQPSDVDRIRVTYE